MEEVTPYCASLLDEASWFMPLAVTLIGVALGALYTIGMLQRESRQRREQDNIILLGQFIALISVMFATFSSFGIAKKEDVAREALVIFGAVISLGFAGVLSRFFSGDLADRLAWESKRSVDYQIRLARLPKKRLGRRRAAVVVFGNFVVLWSALFWKSGLGVSVQSILAPVFPTGLIIAFVALSGFTWAVASSQPEGEARWFRILASILAAILMLLWVVSLTVAVYLRSPDRIFLACIMTIFVLPIISRPRIRWVGARGLVIKIRGFNGKISMVRLMALLRGVAARALATCVRAWRFRRDIRIFTLGFVGAEIATALADRQAAVSSERVLALRSNLDAVDRVRVVAPRGGSLAMVARRRRRYPR